MYHLILVIIAVKSQNVSAAQPDVRNRSAIERQLVPDCIPGQPCFQLQNIAVHPIWLNAFAFDNKRKTVSGTLKIQMKWTTHFDFGGPDLDDSFDPRRMIIVDNFASSSGKTTLGEIPIFRNGELAETDSGLIYTGDFKQDLDLLCFPFDEQTIRWTISIMKPGDKIMILDLFCGEDQTVELNEAGKVNKCTTNSGTTGIGFAWEPFSCEIVDPGSISCSMYGLRRPLSDILGSVLPSFLFILMSYTSFTFQAATKAMPRVGTTIICLLTLTTLKNKISSGLPSIEGLAWLEMYAVLGILLMWESLMATGLVFYFDKRGLTFQRDLVDHLHLAFGFPVFLIMSFSILLGRNCPGTTTGSTVVIALAASLLLVMSFVFIQQYKRHVANIAFGSTDKDEEIGLDHERSTVIDE